MKRRTELLVVLLTFLLVTGCGGQRITGHITAPDGAPVGNLTVTLYRSVAGTPFSELATAVTDKSGAFGLKTDYRGDAVLEIAGETGAGRIHIVKDAKKYRLDATYPVKEKVVFLHDNDMHFDFNSLNTFRSAVEDIRKTNNTVFLFNAGDITVRHRARWMVDGELMTDPNWYGERANFMIDTMNSLGYDLMTPGNHELAYVRPFTRAALDKANFPIIAANIEVVTDGVPQMEPFQILYTDTMRSIAVVGLAVVSLPADSTGVVFNNPIETMGKYMYLADGNDMLVALTHIGYNVDKQLAERYPDIDVIIGGHSHTLLENAELVNTVLVAQAGGSEHVMAKDHVKYLGEVDMIMENGEIVDKRGHVTAMPLP